MRHQRGPFLEKRRFISSTVTGNAICAEGSASVVLE
jgi:hypothetical protein